MVLCLLLSHWMGGSIPDAYGDEAQAATTTTNANDSAELAHIDRGAAGDVVPPSLHELHTFLRNLDERDKGKALNVLADLSAEGRLDPDAVALVLQRLVREDSPPEEFGYQCKNCFQRRLSELLAPLRLAGPRVAPPEEGVVVVRLNDGFMRRLNSKATTELGGNLTGLVNALVDGYDLVNKFNKDAWARYHGRDADPRTEPAFFHSAADLKALEASLAKPLDAWQLARWSCQRPPSSRFEPGFILLYFRPSLTCTEVRIPTAADTEDPYFRPTPVSQTRSGFSCGGAAEWVCPNIRLFEITGARYVPNEAYLR